MTRHWHMSHTLATLLAASLRAPMGPSSSALTLALVSVFSRHTRLAISPTA